MAAINFPKIALALACVVLPSMTAWAEQSEEVPRPEALNAYESYWRGFSDYEKRLLKEGKGQYTKSWSDLVEAYEKDDQAIAGLEISHLESAAKSYRKQIEQFPNASNRPYVMLNLAQVLNLLADLTNAENKKLSIKYKTESLEILGKIEEDYLDFSKLDATYYLHALILESIKQKEDALKVWRSLARRNYQSLFAVHANVAIGDHLFEATEPKGSLKYYQTAQAILAKIDVPNDAFEKLRVQYRIAWASYKAGEISITLKAATDLLQPGEKKLPPDRQTKIQRDAVELIGDTLYESNRTAVTQRTLRQKDLRTFASAIGLRSLQKYSDSGLYGEVVKLGTFLIDEFPTSRELPDILYLVAAAHENLGQRTKQVGVLERLAILLPAESLWRSRVKNSDWDVRNMEEKAEKAARIVADYHYEGGLASGNAASFSTALAYYEMLERFKPAGPESNLYRLRIGNCSYFSDRLEQAAEQYSRLKSLYVLDENTLQIASYQLVLTYQKLWRRAYEKASSLGTEPSHDKKVQEYIGSLEKSIDEFANRFPKENRSVDLLLIGGETNRDLERYDQACNFWQRVLLLNPTLAQRTLAIRGLVYAQTKGRPPAEVIATAKRFLNLEDWKLLSASLQNELKDVLANSTIEEGTRLSTNGQLESSGRLLVAVAQEFRDIPGRDKIYRDGAYMLGSAGNWQEAESAAKSFLDEGPSPYTADITYLKARAEENLIQFSSAASSYIQIGERFPKHPQAKASLMRAERLSVAENDYLSAAKAAVMLGDRAQSSAERLAAYARAAKYAEKADASREAALYAQKSISAARNKPDQLSSQLLLAKMLLKSGNSTDQNKALKLIRSVAVEAEASRGSLTKTNYENISGEANFILAEEERDRFADFSIFARSGTVATNLSYKTKIMDEMNRLYDKAIKSGHPEWASRARYRAGEAAEELAGEVASIPAHAQEPLQEKVKQRYQEITEHLRAVAQKYHSSNALASSRDPKRHKDNEWIKRSSLRLETQDPQKTDSKREMLPAAIHLDLPYQWSL